MKVQKFNSNIVILEKGNHIDSSKGIIEQIEDYIDGLNLNGGTAILQLVEVHGGTYTIIGTCSAKNSWSTFLVMNYFLGNVFHLCRADGGSWSYKQLS